MSAKSASQHPRSPGYRSLLHGNGRPCRGFPEPSVRAVALRLGKCINVIRAQEVVIQAFRPDARGAKSVEGCSTALRGLALRAISVDALQSFERLEVPKGIPQLQWYESRHVPYVK